MSAGDRNQAALRRYYQWHASVYDLTRWAFLFGRRSLVAAAAAVAGEPSRILEVGCGTGSNLVALAEAWPEAAITGLDLSAEMLARAAAKTARYGDRITLLHRPYDVPVSPGDQGAFDLVVFSYSLSMINPGHDEVIARCRDDLRPGGAVAVVDFHETRWPWFRRWMNVNHVRMEGQILEPLDSHFESLVCRVESGYGDLWRYLLYVGRRPGEPAAA